MFWVKKATAAAFALSAVFALGVGAGLSTRTASTGAVAQDGMPETGTVPKAQPPATATVNERAEEIAKLVAERKTLTDALDAGQKNLADNKRRVAAINARITELLAEPPKPQMTAADREKVIADAEELVRKIERKYVNAREGARAAKDRWELTKKAASTGIANVKEVLDAQVTFARFQDESEAVADQLKQARDRLAKLKGPAVKAESGYLELTLVTSLVPEGEYALKEIDAAGKVLGTAITREPEMLVKLLSRTRLDPTAPKELRVTVHPASVLTGWPASLIKACDSAGYETVTFTGYVFQGGLATQLRVDQKGDVRGYKRYDAVEVKSTELLKEIEDGLRRY